jgi:phage shock protein PspC (stress-responsive transcriptional regulator)
MTSTRNDPDGATSGDAAPRGTSTATGPLRPLRRSTSDRFGVGVCGGLAEFFGVDPIIFRVLFVAMTFVGGLGVAVYLACWIAIPDDSAPNSALDHWVASARARGIPMWVLGLIALVVVWVGLFSWWTPIQFGPVAAIAAVLAIAFVAMRRQRGSRIQAWTSYQPAPAATGPDPAGPRSWADPADPTVSLLKVDASPAPIYDAIYDPAAYTVPPAGSSAAPTAQLPLFDPPIAGATASTPPVVAVIPTATAQLREWWAQSHRPKGQFRNAQGADIQGAARPAESRGNHRGRLTEIAAYALLFAVWLVLALISLSSPLPIQAFLWTAFGIVLGVTLLGALVRRPRWRMLVGVGFITVLILMVGTYPARIGDPTGQQISTPSRVADIHGSYRMLAGEQELDLSDVDFGGESVSVTLTQGAGHILVTVPADVDVTVDSRSRFGELDIFGQRTDGAQNHRADTNLSPTIADGTLTLHITLLAGQVEVVRADS